MCGPREVMIAHMPATADRETVDPGTTGPGTAELQLGIVMADPGNTYQHLSGGPSS